MSLNPRLYRMLWALGVLCLIVSQYMIMTNTSTLIVNWDGPEGGGEKVLGVEVNVPVWVYLLQYLGFSSFLMGTLLYIRYWYHSRNV